MSNPRLFMALGALFVVGCLNQFYPPSYPLERKRIDRGNHTSIFPIASGAHAGMDCNACHGQFSTFTRFSCITCHDHAQAANDSLHVGVAGYRYGDTTCYTCHPTGAGMSREAHASFFPIVGGVHGSIGCGECHPSGTATFSCITCHNHAQAATDSLHVGATGYSYGPTTCFTCHPTGAGMSREAHASLFPIVNGAHGSIGCGECHPSGLTTFDCITCHNHTCTVMDGKHTDVPNYSCTSSGCFNCHPQGIAGGGN